MRCKMPNMTAFDDLPAMLTVPETAQALRASESTVRRWLRDGVLQGVKVGGRGSKWLIPKEAVRSLLQPVVLAGGREFPKPAVAVGRPRLGESLPDDAPTSPSSGGGGVGGIKAAGRGSLQPRIIG